jgi:hypothetical protein
MSLAAILLAVTIDISTQLTWTWHGVDAARLATSTGDLAPFLHLEASLFARSAGWAGAGYTLGAIAWTWCFAAFLTRRLAALSIATWTLFSLAAALAIADPASPLATTTVSVANALAFVLLLIWFMAVYERVLRRSRLDMLNPGLAPWRLPSSAPLSRLCNVMVNSRIPRAVGAHIRGLAMSSDITDVVYVNYLVEATVLERHLTPPLDLQRLGPDGRYAMFTFLTYRHHHFGPTCFGRWRRLWPSPIQSNWRIYVRNPRTETTGIQSVPVQSESRPRPAG